jgi:hypothetical protein
MLNRPFLPSTAIAFCLVFAAAALVPTAVAQETEWQNEVPGIAVAPTELALATGGSSGEDVMLAYKATGTADVGIAFRDSTTNAWSIKTTALSGGTATNGAEIKIDYAGGAWWVHYWNDETTDKYYWFKSTDNGATWTSMKTIAQTATTVPAKNSHDLTAGLGGSDDVVIAYFQGSRTWVEYSPDGGTTWGAANPVNDNDGAPGALGTVVVGNSGAALQSSPTNGYLLVFNHATTGLHYYIHSADAAFWTTPSDGVVQTGFNICHNRENNGATTCVDWSYTSCGGCTVTPRGVSISRDLQFVHVSRSGAAVETTRTEFADMTPAEIRHNTYGGATYYSGFLSNMPGCSSGTEVGQGDPSGVRNTVGQVIMVVSCAADSTTRILYRPAVGASVFTSLLLPTTSLDVAADHTPTKFFAAITNGDVGGRAEVYWVESPPINTVVASDESLAFTGGLLGWDVNPYMGALAVRYNEAGTRKIATYDPADFTPQLANTPSPCNRSDGVMVYQKASGSVFVGYVDCPSTDTAKTTTLKIRGSNLGDPDQSGTVCSGGDFCDYQLQTDSGLLPLCQGGQGAGFPTDAGQIGSLESVPISWEIGDVGDALRNREAVVGFVYYHTGNGRLGVFLDKQTDNAVDQSCAYEVPFTTPSTDTVQLCSWRDPATVVDYVVGASQSSGSRIWKLTVDPKFGEVFLDAPSATITVMRQLAAPYDKLNGVSCYQGPDLLVATTTGTIARIVPVAGQLLIKWTTTASSSFTRNVAISNDGLWCAYVYSTTIINICNALTGETTGTIEGTWTGATFDGLRLDDTGQTLFVAASNTITRYALQEAGVTTQVPVAPGTRCTNSNGEAEAATGDESQACVTVNPDGTVTDPIGPDPSIPGEDATATGICGIVEVLSLGAIAGEDACFITGLLIICGFVAAALLLGRNTRHIHLFAMGGGLIGYASAIYAAGFVSWPLIVGVIAMIYFASRRL